MGKPAATDRPRLPSLSHSFTLDFIVLCNGTKTEALTAKEELKHFLESLGLTLSEEKTKVTHITEGFNFLGYRVVKSLGTNGKMISKVEIPERAMTRYRHKVREILAPNTTNESFNAKITALNQLTQGWCEYYRCTNNPARDFGKLRPELYWGIAHWLGKKYKLHMPAILRRFSEANTFRTNRKTLKMPSEYKAKRFVARTWHNPYTEPEQIAEEKARIKRESLFDYDKVWTGIEYRHGRMDLREEVLLRDGPICAICKNTFNPYEVHVDHTISRARFKDPEDADRLENMRVLCTECHRAKTKIDRKVLSRVR